MTTLDAGGMTASLAANRRRQGDVQGACAILEPLVKQGARDAIVLHEWGTIMATMGAEAAAKRALALAVSQKPDFVAAWQMLGDLHILDGDRQAADKAYARALLAGLRDATLLPAAAALCEGQPGMAEQMLKPRVQRQQHDLPALLLLAAAAMRVGRAVEAEAVLHHCLEIAPGFREARHSLAILLYLREAWANAVPHFQYMLRDDPHSPAIRKALSWCFIRLGDFERALPILEAMLAAFRDQAGTWLQYGHALKTLGRVEEAAAAYRVCIELVPAGSAAYVSLSNIKTVRFTDQELAAMKSLAEDAATPAEDTAHLHYAIGSVLEKARDYAASFHHYASGARAQRALVQYDAARMSARCQRIAALFNAELFAARAGSGHPTQAPIFVVGLPRSGSTLVEQILASHSQVEGTQELTEIGAIAASLVPAGDECPAQAALLDRHALSQLGARYLRNTLGFRKLKRPFFIDKNPDNFLHAGLIHLILPNARIIDIRRRPMAAGFAVFKQYFPEGYAFSYDLSDIGRYYRDYAALMAHFDLALPGRVHHIEYEALIADTDGEIRRLLAYCGLDFEPSCLRYWETRREIRTPSAEQVRQPIYSSAVHQWKNYAPWLGALREALEDE